MPECYRHPGVETSVTCTECGRYICTKDMVATPVGYKCPECGVSRLRKGGVKPRQLALGAAFGLGAAVILAPIAQFIPLFFFSVILYGALVGEATRRGGGGHRSWEFVAIAAVCALVGAGVSAVVFAPDLFLLVGGPIIAGVYVASMRWF